MSHRLSAPGLKESSNLGLKGLDKPCCSQIGKQRPRGDSHLPQVTEQAESPYTHVFRLPQCSLVDPKKTVIKQMEPLCKTWLPVFCVWRGH